MLQYRKGELFLTCKFATDGYTIGKTSKLQGHCSFGVLNVHADIFRLLINIRRRSGNIWKLFQNQSAENPFSTRPAFVDILKS